MPSFINFTLHIDEKGINLLRNRFVCRHLDFQEIEQFRIENGYLKDLTVFLGLKFRTQI